MASNLQPLSPLPTPSEPLVDLKTGRISTSWYRYFNLLDSHIREVEARLDDHDTRIDDLETP